ncbi:MAG: chaperonin GroES [Candidatus Sumerlaeota bacterium]|nr:chaperonin GroES [Candidatus Sumerlaeota bacterium]
MQLGNKQMLVVGDRVLVKPDDANERTKVGLYLPQTVIEKEPVQSGAVVEVGPGIAIPNFAADTAEPWQQRRDSPVRFVPLQVDVGDHVLFLRKEAVEIRYLEQTFLVVPQAAILLLIREDGL